MCSESCTQISSMFWQIQRHPGRAVGLLQIPAGGQRGAAVEHADVVQPQETTLEDVLAEAVLAVHPPGEVEQQLVEAALEPVDVTLPAPRFLQPVGEGGGPGVHRRIDVAEIPFVRRDLPAGMQILPLEHQVQLLLAEVLVHQRQREHVKRQVPRRVPGIFPLVRHRQDVGVVHVVPVLVAGSCAPSRLERVGAAFFEPFFDVVVVELLGPHHAGQRLAHHVGRIRAQRRRNDRRRRTRPLPADAPSSARRSRRTRRRARAFEASAEGAVSLSRRRRVRDSPAPTVSA